MTAPLATVVDGQLRVGRELFERMVVHGRTWTPKECCAIGIGPAGNVAEFHELDNVHETPITRYEIASADQLRLYLRGEEEGWDTTLVFHTHPATQPYPSATDLSLAGWPDAVYAIMGLADEEPLLRAYRIVDGQVDELDVAILDEISRSGELDRADDAGCGAGSEHGGR